MGRAEAGSSAAQASSEGLAHPAYPLLPWTPYWLLKDSHWNSDLVGPLLPRAILSVWQALVPQDPPQLGFRSPSHCSQPPCLPACRLAPVSPCGVGPSALSYTALLPSHVFLPRDFPSWPAPSASCTLHKPFPAPHLPLVHCGRPLACPQILLVLLSSCSRWRLPLPALNPSQSLQDLWDGLGCLGKGPPLRWAAPCPCWGEDAFSWLFSLECPLVLKAWKTAPLHPSPSPGLVWRQGSHTHILVSSHLCQLRAPHHCGRHRATALPSPLHPFLVPTLPHPGPRSSHCSQCHGRGAWGPSDQPLADHC